MAVTDPTARPPVAASFRDGVTDWRAAVRAAAGQLVELGVAGPDYVEACIRSVETSGPYIVLTPGLALAHAQSDRTEAGLAVTRLAEPVAFGHPANDPVDLVLAFSPGAAGSHIAMIAALGRALGAGLAARLRAAPSVDAAREALEEVAADVR